MPNLKAIPSYLSEDDALTVNLFLQSEYARDYAIDIRNIRWGGEIHHSHVFDIYAAFSPMRDPVKVRLDMLQFVSENQQRYDWNAHLYLRMNQLTLDNWVGKMTHWDNCADPLAIYSLSDMLGIHTTILTKTKPWTTVSGEYEGSVHDLLKISKVSLVYLGENRFARLWQKDDPGDSSYIGPNFNYHFTPLPVTPALPAKPKPKRRKTLTGKHPTQEELQTAETLLELSGTQAEPLNPPSEMLTDAMDKIVGHLDTMKPPKMPPIDAVDSMCRPVLHVETVTPTQSLKQDTVLCVETKQCSVQLKRLDLILRDELVKVIPSSARDLPVGERFTRSRSTKPTTRKGSLPRRASTGISYDEKPISPKPKPVRPSPKPSRAGPTLDRIVSRTKNSLVPLVRLPGVKADPRDVEDSDATIVVEEEPLSNDSPEDDIPLVELKRRTRGVFKTTSHVLEKKTESRKYKCRMCPTKVESCRELTVHHQTQHGIIYCTVCRKAFNNPRTLTKHMYEHSVKKFVCKRCGSKFYFESQLKTHRLTHRKANQRCMYHKCGKLFKSKGDLNRHAATHTKSWLVCPDCDNYKTKDKRNFDSHRFSHSKIERYFCEKCGTGFVHNTQKLRHLKNNKCK